MKRVNLFIGLVLVPIIMTLSIESTTAQSKKEKIELLNFRVDSLMQILFNERKDFVLSNGKLHKENSALFSLNSEMRTKIDSLNLQLVIEKEGKLIIEKRLTLFRDSIKLLIDQKEELKRELSIKENFREVQSHENNSKVIETIVSGEYLLSFSSTDSFPPTDIYGDLPQRNNLTENSGNYYEMALKIQNYLSEKFKDYFYTTSSNLVLKLSSGKTISFLKKDNKDGSRITFEHYFKEIDYFLLRVFWDEGGCWMLVNRKNGFKQYIYGLPYISPDNKLIITTNSDLWGGYTFNGIELYSIQPDTLKVEFREETKFGPRSVKWVSVNRFLLERGIIKEDESTGDAQEVTDFISVLIEKRNGK